MVAAKTQADAEARAAAERAAGERAEEEAAAKRARAKQAPDAELDSLFDELDSDKDNMITRREWQTFASAQKQAPGSSCARSCAGARAPKGRDAQTRALMRTRMRARTCSRVSGIHAGASRAVR